MLFSPFLLFSTSSLLLSPGQASAAGVYSGIPTKFSISLKTTRPYSRLLYNRKCLLFQPYIVKSALNVPDFYYTKNYRILFYFIQGNKMKKMGHYI
jgi:hypothetical protein